MRHTKSYDKGVAKSTLQHTEGNLSSDGSIQSISTLTVALQFNSHKSVQKLFHNLHIIFSNSLMGFKVICQLEKEPLKGLADVQEIFS